VDENIKYRGKEQQDGLAGEPTNEVMRDRLKGIVSDGCAAFERRSDWPEVKTPAFQSYFTQEVIINVLPNTEGGLQKIVDYRFRVPLA